MPIPLLPYMNMGNTMSTATSLGMFPNPIAVPQRKTPPVPTPRPVVMQSPGGSVAAAPQGDGRPMVPAAVGAPGTDSALAKALIQGAQPTGPMYSIAEPLGRLAELWAGTRLAKQTEKSQLQQRQQAASDLSAWLVGGRSGPVPDSVMQVPEYADAIMRAELANTATKTTPYSDVAKIEQDFKNGLIDQNQRDTLVAQAQAGTDVKPTTVTIRDPNDPNKTIEAWSYPDGRVVPIGQAPDKNMLSPEAYQQKLGIAGAGAAKTIGTPPAGWAIQYDDKGNPIGMTPIPGGPADTKAQAEKDAKNVGYENQGNQAQTMLSTTQNIRGEIKKGQESGFPVTGTASIPFSLYSGTPAGRVRSYVKALQSGVALQAMMRLKQASATGATGFGQLSNKELGILINNIGALDPNTTDPDIFMQTLDRIDQQYQAALDDIRRNVDPQRIKELGLEPLLNGTASLGAPGMLQAPASPVGNDIYAPPSSPGGDVNINGYIIRRNN